MERNKFRVGDHEYTWFAQPLADGGYTTSIVYTNHGRFPPEETRLDSAYTHASEEDALAHAEVVAYDLAKRHLD